MERKSGRPSVPSKGNGSECKKENGNGAKFQKNNRKKESSANRPKAENVARRPQSQRARGMDKRPRPRGYCNERQREEMMAENRADYGSALAKGSRKTNLNHLLNFTFAPRDNFGGLGPSSNRGDRGGGRRGRFPARTILKYNKEQFLQANCQFVVRDGEDYMIHGSDPDTLVEWDRIEQLRIFSNEITSCPICLYPPTAAKITRCGHIYCWTCILHYLSLSEKSWHKCPICYESVQKKDLKSVVVLETHPYKVGQEITMKLMRRERGSTYALPKSQWTSREGKPHYVNDDVDICYTKMLLATADHVQSIIDIERLALMRQLREEGEDTLEGSFVQAALELLKVRQDSLRQAAAARCEVEELMSNMSLKEESIEAAGNSPSSLDGDQKPPTKDIVRYSSAFDEELEPQDQINPADQQKEDPEKSISEVDETDVAAAPVPETVTMATEQGEKEVTVDEAAEQLAMPSDVSTQASKREQKPANEYYFYQAEDGQHIYVHSLNARCLVKEYGSLEHCPDTITAVIVDLEGISMTYELRKRLRYLSHLPLTCEFKVAELALKPPVVSPETLELFTDEIERRRRLRNRRNRDEKRKLKKMQEIEDKKMGIYPAMRVTLSSMHHFPETGTDPVPVPDVGRTRGPGAGDSNTSTPLSITPHGTPIGSPPGTSYVQTSASTGVLSSSEEGGQTSTLSFAQMLQAGKARPTEAWPRVRQQSESSTSSHAQRKGSGSDDSDDEGRIPVPQYQESFGDAIQVALDNYLRSPGQDVEVNKESSGGKKKRKQKKQKTLLFTTTMARSK